MVDAIGLLQSAWEQLQSTGVEGAMMRMAPDLEQLCPLDFIGRRAHWSNLGAFWMLASIAGALSTGVRVYRRLQRAQKALSILPSRVEQEATTFVLGWDGVDLPPRHLRAFEVGYEALHDAENVSLWLPESGSCSGWWRGKIPRITGWGLGAWLQSPDRSVVTPPGSPTRVLWSLFCAGCSVGWAGRMGVGGGGGDRSVCRSWARGCLSVQMAEEMSCGARKDGGVRLAASRGVEVSVSGLRPGMVYKLRITGISSDGVRGVPSPVINLC